MRMIQLAPDLPAFAVEKIKKLNETLPLGRVISADLIPADELRATGLSTRSNELAVAVRIQLDNGRIETLSLAVHPGKDVRFPK